MAACREDDSMEHEQASPVISFASSLTAQDDAPQTRTSTSPLECDFTVYGYKTKSGGDVQKVFDGYQVSYKPNSADTSEENTHNYSYIDDANNQSIKYWDFDADEYHFWGATGGIFSADGTSLTFEGLATSVTDPFDKRKLYSELYNRAPVTDEVVRLLFKRPYAKMRVLFYYSEQLQQLFDNIKITDISFAPSDGTTKVTTKGSVTVSYPKSGDAEETVSVNPTEQAEAYAFGDVTLDKDHGLTSNDAVLAVPVSGTDYYYVLPNPGATGYMLSAHVDGNERTSVVPAVLMQWKPNFVYTYIFKITDALKIEVYDVHVDPWQFGGSQDEEWRNW